VAVSIRDRNTQLVAIGVIALILIAFLVLKVMGGGGSSPTALPGGTLPSIAPSPTPTESAPPVLLFSGRDPFQPQFTVATSNPSGTPTAPSGGSTPGQSVSPASNPAPGPGDGASVTIDGHTVVLIDIFQSTNGTKMAQVEVDGTVYTVAAGQTFDDNFKLVNITGDPCGHFVFGDQTFQLCETANK
jgi:hypothetical protein